MTTFPLPRGPYTEPGWLDTWMGQIELYAGHGWPPSKIATFLEPSVNGHYRKRGARSAYLTADEVIEARARARSIMVPQRIAPALAAIERAEAFAADQARVRARDLRAKARSATYMPGSRNHRVWQAVRSGRTRRDVAAEFGISRSRVGGIVQVQDEVEAARLEVERNRRWARPAARRNLGRPLDMGGPRDVWLTYLPSSDPRLDNMVPVT